MQSNGCCLDQVLVECVREAKDQGLGLAAESVAVLLEYLLVSC